MPIAQLKCPEMCYTVNRDWIWNLRKGKYQWFEWNHVRCFDKSCFYLHQISTNEARNA